MDCFMCETELLVPALTVRHAHWKPNPVDGETEDHAHFCDPCTLRLFEAIDRYESVARQGGYQLRPHLDI